MKKYLLIFFLSVFAFKAISQEQQNVADLDFLYENIKKLPSYKDQLKNNEVFEQLYQRLRLTLGTNNNELEVFQKLAQLIYPIKDNHLAFYRAPDSSFVFTRPMPSTDLSLLEKKYIGSAKDSLEGIYYNFKGSNKYIVYQKEPGIYYLQNMVTRALECILTKNAFKSFDAIDFNAPYAYTLRRNIKLINGILIGLPYKKSLQPTFSDVGKVAGSYEYKIIDENIGYLRLGSFYSSPANIKKATDFFNLVRPTIKSASLIVDVRSNFGGGYKTSKQFIDFLINYKGKIYILQNAYTGSNAEQFILKLKEARTIVTLGEPTRGIITYGSNYDNRITLPSKRFVFYPTDMKGSSKELAYESVGVSPDVSLDPYAKDWIEQTLLQIK